MVGVSSPYDYWMPRYIAKCQIVQYLLIYPTHIRYPIYTRYSASILHISYTYRVPDISFFDQWRVGRRIVYIVFYRGIGVLYVKHYKYSLINTALPNFK